MKKIVSAILICSLLLGLTSCGKAEEKTSEMTTEASEMEASVNDAEYSGIATATEATALEATELEAEVMINPKSDILISIDPGHQSERIDMSALEPNAPGSSEMKAKATGGTTGRFTGVPEYQLNLDISLKLRDKLEEEGYNVIMTREDNDTAISNMERACLANDAGADISIRIHANGSDDSSVSGALAMVGSSSNPNVGVLYDDSYALATNVLDEYCANTGMSNQGVQTTDTMTGINWSQVPVMILEMGYMTNQTDDTNMQNADYQTKMVEGIVFGINKYFGLDNGYYTIPVEVPHEASGLEKSVNDILDSERNKGAVCSAFIKNLKTGETINLSTATHRAASVIKLFIAGKVYEDMDRLKRAGYSESNLDALVEKMISASDNDSANQLVRILGLEDADKGMAFVNEYIQSLGYTECKMGRLMLDFDSEKENYVEVAEVGDYLEKLYNGDVKGAEKIVGYMKKQERTGKIPAGLPSGVKVANKTGELEDVEHDVAIVYGEDSDYILCVLMSQLSSTSEGVEAIKKVSQKVYEEWK
ncbi:MAG: N-acetylmuramoyl-L-alanine amidase [Eubacterium sp.]|nr:N-acetylmuramoyl-L-alanine amidase [Eubacterium sp.]